MVSPEPQCRPTTFGLARASLRHRLLLLVLLAVLPTVALILSTASEQRRQAVASAKEDALRLARLASSQHEHLIEGARSLLVGLAQLSDVQMHNSRACSALFAEVQLRFPLYKNVGAIRPDGHVFCTASSPAPGVGEAGERHFEQARATREFAVGDYRFDPVSGKPVLVVSYPAVDGAGDVWAVVFAELDLDWISQFARRAALPPGSMVTVMDGAGLILAAYPDSALVGKSVPQSPVVQAIRRQAGDGTLEAPGPDGAPRLYAFASLAGAGPAVSVAVGLPRHAALAETERLLARNLIWDGVVILLVIAASLVVSDLFILRRVGAVVRAARRLSAGDLSARASVRGRDEIAVMARTFNAMADGLQSRARDEREAREQLGERVNELDLLNQMGELLQSCFTLEEAYGVIGRLGPRLFPPEDGAVFALDSSQKTLEAVATWGTHPVGAAAFSADSCWAMRNGRTHVVQDSGSDVLCAHLPKPVPAAYLCTPLAPQGKALGVLFVMIDSEAEAPAHELTQAKQRLAEAVAGHLGLGLANVHLREVLRIQSFHDQLTGLFNRRYMEETLERETHRARRGGRPMSILMLDVDSFKQQNDVFGHEAGDAILRELGALLKASLRREDIPCRYGGEEFALVLPEASMEGAARRAEQIRQAVKGLRIPFNGRVLGPITVSIGVAAFPDHGPDGHAVLQAADAALYHAKRTGRDRISVATLHPTV